MEKLIGRFVGDERVRQSYGRAAVITLFMMWIYMIVRVLLVSMGIWEVNFIQNDFYFMLITFIIFTTIAEWKETDDLNYSPLLRKELPHKDGRFGGRLVIYIPEAAIAAAFITLMEFLVKNLIALSFTFDLLEIVSTFIAFMIIMIFVNVVIGEIRIRKYRTALEDD